GREALHQPGDGEEPRPPHPREARGGYPDPRGRDRAPRRDHRLSTVPGDAERARLTERIITAEQDERRRLAVFLHDGPVQHLAGIALMLDAALGAIDAGKVDEARTILSAALDRHRAT